MGNILTQQIESMSLLRSLRAHLITSRFTAIYVAGVASVRATVDHARFSSYQQWRRSQSRSFARLINNSCGNAVGLTPVRAAARVITSVSILIYKRCGCAAGGHVRLSQSRPTCQSFVAVPIIIARPTDLRWVIGLSFGVYNESKLLQNCLWLVENILTQQ